jgi:predicted alpha/beta-fold hydrolase
MPRVSDDFQPAVGLSNGHAQTFFATLVRPALRELPLRRRRFDTPDGDFFDVDVLDGKPGAPTVLLLHGLEGSSASGYMHQMLAGCRARGWHGWALNARSCSGEPNRLASSYSSGDFRDAQWLLEHQLGGPIAVVGFSLGGSATLNLLAKAAPGNVRAAVAVSAPFELERGARYLDSREPLARVYLANFLVPMKKKALEKARRFPGELDAMAIRAARGIRDFDHVVTAPLNGFSSAEDYYARCSAGPQLQRITVPTLLLSAQDDLLAPPLVPPAAMEQPNLDVLVTARGGHVGFVEGSALRPRWWGEQRVLRWLDDRLG